MDEGLYAEPDEIGGTSWIATASPREDRPGSPSIQRLLSARRELAQWETLMRFGQGALAGSMKGEISARTGGAPARPMGIGAMEAERGELSRTLSPAALPPPIPPPGPPPVVMGGRPAPAPQRPPWERPAGQSGTGGDRRMKIDRGVGCGDPEEQHQHVGRGE